MPAVDAPQLIKWVVIVQTLTDKKLYIPFEFLPSDISTLPKNMKAAAKASTSLPKDILYKLLLKHFVADIATISPVQSPLSTLYTDRN
jgi:hypothetical protein